MFVLLALRMSIDAKQRHFCIVTQVYPPDPAAVGQHLADVAEELGQMGHRVTVYSSDRGYDDPSQKYQRTSRHGNVTIIRLPWTSFGKGSISSRLLGGTSLLLQASLLSVINPQITDLLVSTIPHLAGALGVAMKVTRRMPFHYWLMDLNPDQIVAHGKLAADSIPVKAFDLLNRGIIRYASTITTLDDAMARRFAEKSNLPRAMRVQPPWPIQGANISFQDVHGPFRSRYGLSTERVIMHAGNHSVVHPLDTLVKAIRAKPNTTLRYFFVGGGLGKRSIEAWVREEHPSNVILLPYQPREEIEGMISAADVHVVSVGNGTVGIVHPSKIYGALAAGRPVIVLGEPGSPAVELVTKHDLGWCVEHGNNEKMSVILETIERMPVDELVGRQRHCHAFAIEHLSKKAAVREFCESLGRSS